MEPSKRVTNRDSLWQWGFGFLLTAIIATNGYIINKVDEMDKRQSSYIERMSASEVKFQFIHEEIDECKSTTEDHESRLQRLEAILPKKQTSLIGQSR